MKTIFVAATLAALMLSGCGDGGDDDHNEEALKAQAASKEAEARQLGVDTPCATDAQCSRLSFVSLNHETNCVLYSSKSYSLISSTAAQARAAAAEQNALAKQVLQARPGDSQNCPSQAPEPPPSCSANKCL